MDQIIRKETAVQFYFSFYFNWGFYFSAGYLLCKKVWLFLSNEWYRKLRVLMQVNLTYAAS